MKPITLQLMCPGVSPVAGHNNLYEATSDHGEPPYTVDMSAWFGAGSCACPDFQMHRQPFLKNGHVPTARYDCKHLARVHRFIAVRESLRVLSNRRDEANNNARENGHPVQRYNPELPAY